MDENDDIIYNNNINNGNNINNISENINNINNENNINNNINDYEEYVDISDAEYIIPNGSDGYLTSVIDKVNNIKSGIVDDDNFLIDLNNNIYINISDNYIGSLYDEIKKNIITNTEKINDYDCGGIRSVVNYKQLHNLKNILNDFILMSDDDDNDVDIDIINIVNSCIKIININEKFLDYIDKLESDNKEIISYINGLKNIKEKINTLYNDKKELCRCVNILLNERDEIKEILNTGDDIVIYLKNSVYFETFILFYFVFYFFVFYYINMYLLFSYVFLTILFIIIK
jgi:hypothetical protein